MKPVSLNEHKEEEIIKYPKRLFIGFEKGTEKSDYEVAEKLAINYVKAVSYTHLTLPTSR